ncbi:MAG: UDP-2,3-diacylglucosamine diphosphatase [Balneolaceae bacterium]|nr:MAG: UDP-2,3-diacylglucosamine diphosphatase [Balneolaceae bacterium]
MRYLFLSDIHLGAFSPANEYELQSDLLSIIDYCISESVKIYLLGDLFDYWMEYPDYVPPLGRAILDRFEKYNTQCGSATFITGNHDFWDFGHFSERGFEVEHEYLEISINGSRGLLFHGDGLSDPFFALPRPLLNHLLRAPEFVKLFQSVFAAETGNHLMKSFSDFTRNERSADTAKLSEWADFFLKKSDFDFIITGHDHVPRVETYSSGNYINTGAFFKYRTLAIYTEQGFELVTLENGTLRPFAGSTSSTRS